MSEASSTDSARLLMLTCELFRHKFLYYNKGLLNLDVSITDQAYDELEVEYKLLCDKLGQIPIVSRIEIES